MNGDSQYDGIAIIGMAGRFPGAADIDSFWRLLMSQGDAIRPIPVDRWDSTAELDPAPLASESVGDKKLVSAC